jgi:hypothetical protein
MWPNPVRGERPEVALSPRLMFPNDERRVSIAPSGSTRGWRSTRNPYRKMGLRENTLRDILNQFQQGALNAVPRPVVYLASIGTFGTSRHRVISLSRRMGLAYRKYKYTSGGGGARLNDCGQGSTTVASYNHTATLAPITPDPDDPVEPASTSA